MITTLTDKVIGVEVPEGAENIFIEDLRDWEFALRYKLKGFWHEWELPNPGLKPWKILGRPNELTEDQWKGIVERQRGETVLFKDYQLKGSLAKYGTYTLTNSKDSGMSLLGSHNINPSEVIILIKQ